MEDLLVTIHQPNAFRPFSVSIFSCDLPQLRKQWLFYDFLSANNVSGSYDNSLFTIHPRQTHNYTGAQLNQVTESGDVQWKKQSRLRIDALNIEHLNRGVEGPFSWIHDGNVDIVADIMLPDENISIAKVMSDFYDRMEATVTSASGLNAPMSRSEFTEEAETVGGTTSLTEGSGNRSTKARANATQSSLSTNESSRDRSNPDARFLIMDLRIQLNNVYASVPLFTKDISYINNALVRPIVAYINSKRSFIPINCRVVKEVDEFDGSWTIYDSGLMEDLNKEASELASFRRLAKANITTGLRCIRARCAR
jgi:distribution and morphology protein 31